MIKLGVIGYGYWGPNIVRNFASHPDCRVAAIYDKSPEAVARAFSRHPAVSAASDLDDITGSPEIDAVAIVTAHPGVDWQAVVDRAPLVIDFRGVTRGIRADNLIRL